MRILAVFHGLWIGGAQISVKELLDTLKNTVEIKVLVCDNADKSFASTLKLQGLEIYKTPCTTIMNYPMLNPENSRKLIEWADVVWITDVEYLVAPRVKRLKRVPVVAHLRSYALICPWWGALYGFREVCSRRCSPWRIIRCKQGMNLELFRTRLSSGGRARIYWLLDFIKGPFDFLGGGEGS